MKKTIPFLLIGCLLFSCSAKKKVADLVVHNATIYTVDSTFSTADAMVITDGIIIEVGTAKELLEKYDAV